MQLKVRSVFTNWRQALNHRSGFFWTLVGLFWLKTLLTYLINFHNLVVNDPLQAFILVVNPIATTVILFSIAAYCRRTRFFYSSLLLIDALNSLLLFANVLYYREFSDFLTFSTITGASKVSQGLGGSSISLIHWSDGLVWVDLVLVLVALAIRWIRVDYRPLPKKTAFAMTTFGVLAFAVNLALAESNRPQLLTRQFDRNYTVKYLGLDAFTISDAINDEQTNKQRASAKKSELTSILKYTRKHYAAPDKSMYGIAKGRNVIVIHLESFQQFLIGQKVNGKEVTPFLNSLYNSKSTYAFKNFFHQVGQGKTSDAENMLETSTFGLPTGSLFTTDGSDNTFQAAPAIFNQSRGYSSAVFHGNVASFWNRNNTYKNMGYQYFFDASYFDTSGDKSLGYGLKDKLLFKDSVNYLQHMQQPFYVKYITVTNHIPYDLDEEDTSFKTTDSGSSQIDGYFQTAHYLDQSLKEFFTYLKKSGLYKKSIIMMYGDHYGLSNDQNSTLANTLNFKDAKNWSDYDNAQLQRVPLMFNIPGIKSGKIEKTYGGEIDVLPTLLHLMGISSKKYVQFGTDLFSKQHDQVVAFRNKDFITPKYTVLNDTVYDNATGDEIKSEDQSKALKAAIASDQKHVNQELSLSDSLNTKNLLRFYHPKGFKAINPKDYNYGHANGLPREEALEKKLAKQSKSLFSENNGRSTESLYKTDAPEANHKPTNSTRIKPTNPDDNSESGKQ